MERFHRIFVIVLDSLGIGAMEDAALFGDEGLTRLGISQKQFLNLRSLILPGSAYGMHIRPRMDRPQSSRQGTTGC